MLKQRLIKLIFSFTIFFKPIQIKKYKIASNLSNFLLHQFNINEIRSKVKMSIIAMPFEQLFDHLHVFLFGLLLGFPLIHFPGEIFVKFLPGL